MLLFISLVAGAQVGAPAEKQPNPALKKETAQKSAGPRDSVSTAAAKMSEKDYYKMMYEQAIARENKFSDLTDHTLNYVLWIIGALAAAQVIYNYFLSERQVKKVKSEIKEEVAEELRKQTDAIGVTTENRINNSETAFRASVNRELDNAAHTTKSQLQDLRNELTRLTIQVSTIPRVDEAANFSTQGNHLAALQAILPYGEARITPEFIDNGAAFLLPNYLYQVDEYPEDLYIRVAALYKILKDVGHVSYSFWANDLINKPVYKLASDGHSTRVYIKNAPSTPS